MCGNSMRALEALRRAGAPVTAVNILPDPAIRAGALGAVGLADDPAGLRRRRADRRRRHRRGARGVRRPRADARGEARRGLPRRARGEDRGHRRLSSRTSRTRKTGSVASTISARRDVERRFVSRSRPRSARSPPARAGRARSSRACRTSRPATASRPGSPAAWSCPSRPRRARARNRRRTPTSAIDRGGAGLAEQGRSAAIGRTRERGEQEHALGLEAQHQHPAGDQTELTQRRGSPPTSDGRSGRPPAPVRARSSAPENAAFTIENWRTIAHSQRARAERVPAFGELAEEVRDLVADDRRRGASGR